MLVSDKWFSSRRQRISIAAATVSLFTLSCDGGSPAGSPTVQSFSGVYSGQATVAPHSCPAQAGAPANGAVLSRTVILEDRRPDLNARFAGIAMTGTIDANGNFQAFTPLEDLSIHGRLTSNVGAGGLTLSGVVRHRVAPQFVFLCQWSEDFSGARQP